MEYRLEGVEGARPVSAELVRRPARATGGGGGAEGGDYAVRIDGDERELRILSLGPRGAEFVLGGTYHSVRYERASTARIEMVVDGAPVELSMHSGLDEIVYKNSGGAAAGGAGGGAPDATLRSPIPGKVVSFSTEEGLEVRKGDPVVVLESMKMQVAVKAHRDGTVKSLKVKQGGSVAKNDAIAEIE